MLDGGVAWGEILTQSDGFRAEIIQKVMKGVHHITKAPRTHQQRSHLLVKFGSKRSSVDDQPGQDALLPLLRPLHISLRRFGKVSRKSRRDDARIVAKGRINL
jgi:hypothetical protein